MIAISGFLTASECTKFVFGLGELATQNASQKSSGGGDKNKEVRGTKFKIVATRCHILRLKCTKFDFGWGSAPDPARGAHSAPSDPLAGFKGKEGQERGREGRGEGRKGRRKEGRRGGRGKEGKGKVASMRHGFGGMDAPVGVSYPTPKQGRIYSKLGPVQKKMWGPWGP